MFQDFYRWERFRFGRFALEAKSLDHDTADIHPSTRDLITPTALLHSKILFGMPQKHSMTQQERREKIGDSLFKEEYRTNVCYIDPNDTETNQQILPIITASNYEKVFTSTRIDGTLGNQKEGLV
uniref:Uncharacterized protein n=1 Tax=Lygus hesperus TaxID=30085 RepID=A0A0K8T7L4_LYGHE